MLKIENLQELATQRGIRWNHPAVGFAFACICLAFGVGATRATIGTGAYGVLGSAGVGSFIAGYALWLWTCRIPKNRPDHVGIALAIRTETDDERKRLRSDFISAIRSNLARTEASARFAVVEIPSFLAPDVDDTNGALKFLRKSKCHVLVWGGISTRKRAGADVYCLRLEGVVLHSFIEKPRSDALAQEMRRAIPEKTEIEIINELRGFESASQSTALAAKYIVALAAALSGDLQLSKALLGELSGQISFANGRKTSKDKRSKKEDGHLIGRLRSVLPKRLANVCAAEYVSWLQAWQNDKGNLQLLHLAEKSLEEFLVHRNKTGVEGPEYWIPKAMLEVTLRKDFGAAARLLQRCRALSINDPVWRLSLAFVSVVKGDAAEALNLYEVALDRDVHTQTVFDIEDYIQWWLSTNNGPAELYLLSALLNAKLKNDVELARQDLNRFEALATGSTDQRFVDKAKSLQKELAALAAVGPKLP